MVNLIYLLISVRVDIHLTSRRLFACLGELPTKGLPPVADIPHEALAARPCACAIPRVDHVTHLGGISPPNWKTKPCKRAGKRAETYYIDLACRGLTFIPLDCAA